MNKIGLRNLTKEELSKKVSVLLSAIKDDTPNKELRFRMEATWNESGMTIAVCIDEGESNG